MAHPSDNFQSNAKWRSPHSIPPRRGFGPCRRASTWSRTTWPTRRRPRSSAAGSNFEDLMYLTLKQPGHDQRRRRDLAGGHLRRPGRADQQHAARPRAGELENTGRQLDVGIRARVLQGEDPRLDRRRHRLHAQRQLLRQQRRRARARHGRRLQARSRRSTSRRTRPDDQHQPGRHRSKYDPPAGTNTQTAVGQLELTQFINPQGLKLLGGSIYSQTEASGDADREQPRRGRRGQILQGFLEGSNVDPVKELVTLIKTQRAFELNSQSIQRPTRRCRPSATSAEVRLRTED